MLMLRQALVHGACGREVDSKPDYLILRSC